MRYSTAAALLAATGARCPLPTPKPRGTSDTQPGLAVALPLVRVFELCCNASRRRRASPRCHHGNTARAATTHATAFKQRASAARGGRVEAAGRRRRRGQAMLVGAQRRELRAHHVRRLRYRDPEPGVGEVAVPVHLSDG